MRCVWHRADILSDDAVASHLWLSVGSARCDMSNEEYPIIILEKYMRYMSDWYAGL